MFANERHQKIRQMLLEYKRVSVSRLSKLFNVSEVTMRKDLEVLEKEGFLNRTHGGAVLNGQIAAVAGVSSLPIPESAQDHSIAIIASHLVEDNDFIFLGSGYTCTEIAKNLRHKSRLTVVTNNISAAIMLSEIPDINIITTGGSFNKKNGLYCLVGTAIEDFLNDIYIQKSIVSVDGLSIKRGFTVSDNGVAKIYQRLAEQSNEFIVCSDHSKFDKNSFAHFGDLTLATKIVTDESAPENYIEYFCDHDIPVYNSYEFHEI